MSKSDKLQGSMQVTLYSWLLAIRQASPRSGRQAHSAFTDELNDPTGCLVAALQACATQLMISTRSFQARWVEGCKERGHLGHLPSAV